MFAPHSRRYERPDRSVSLETAVGHPGRVAPAMKVDTM